MKKRTSKTASKRFKITKKGKIIRGHAYSSHLKRKKSKSRLRRQKEPVEVSVSSKKTIKKMVRS